MPSKRRSSIIKNQDVAAATFVVGSDLEVADFKAIQEAVDNLPPEGGTIFLLEGTYALSVTVTLPDKPVRVIGAGIAGTTISLGTVAIPAFTVSGTSKFYQFEGIEFSGTLVAGQKAVKTTTSNWVTSKDCTFDGLDAIYDATSVSSFFSLVDCNLSFLFNGVNSILVNGASSRLVITNGEYLVNGATAVGGSASGLACLFTDTIIGGAGTSTIAVGGNSTVIGGRISSCALTTGGSNSQIVGVDLSVSTLVLAGSFHRVIGCKYASVTTAISVTATLCVVSSNSFASSVTNAVVESGGANSNRYGLNDGFEGKSTVIGASSKCIGQDISCRVTKAAAQSIPNNTDTAVIFDTERYDTDAMHDNAVNNTRITITKPGKYVITGQVEWAATSVGVRQLGVRKNGATVLARVNDLPVTIGAAPQVVTTTDVFINGDYVELMALQTAGVGLDIQKSGNYSPEFEAQLVG